MAWWQSLTDGSALLLPMHFCSASPHCSLQYARATGIALGGVTASAVFQANRPCSPVVISILDAVRLAFMGCSEKPSYFFLNNYLQKM